MKYKHIFVTDQVTDEEYLSICDFAYDCLIALTIGVLIIGTMWRICSCFMF